MPKGVIKKKKNDDAICATIIRNENPPNIEELAKNDHPPLSKYYKWSTWDDYLLKKAVENGYDAKAIADSVKFSHGVSEAEILDRWKFILTDRNEASRVSRRIGILKQAGLKSKVPFSEKEDRLIVKEIKEKGYVSADHLLDQHVDKFHPSRRVSDIESRVIALRKKNDFGNAYHFHMTKSQWKQARDSLISTLSEKEREVILTQGDRLAISKRTALLKENEENSRAEALTTLKLEYLLQDLHALETNRNVDPIYGWLEGRNIRYAIKTNDCIIGRGKKAHVDISAGISAEELKSISRKQLKLTFSISTKKKPLLHVTTGLDQKQFVHRHPDWASTDHITFQFSILGKGSVCINETEYKKGQKCVVHSGDMITLGEKKALFVFRPNYEGLAKWFHEQLSKTQSSGVKSSGVKSSGVKSSGVKSSGVKSSGVNATKRSSTVSSHEPPMKKQKV